MMTMLRIFIATLFVTLTVIVSTDTGALAQETAPEVQCAGNSLLPEIKAFSPNMEKDMRAEAQASLFGTGTAWKIEKAGIEPSTLFGTMHLADPRLLKLAPGVQRAFDRADTLALEITEILDPAVMASKAFSLLKYTTYADGTTLSDKMSATDVELIKASSAEKLGLPWSIAGRMKPWALMGSLSLPACEMARKRAQKPFLDLHLGLQAKQSGKKIVGLETLESQMQAMASLPESFALNGLIQSVRLGKRMDDVFETMIQLYTKGEIALIWSVIQRVGENGFVEPQENADMVAFQQTIVDKRNVDMVKAATSLIDEGNAFIAVGALHLPGEKGMLKILAQQGYKISPITD